MRRLIKEKLYILGLAILTAFVIVVFVYAGAQYWGNYSQEKQKTAELLKEEQINLEIQKEREELEKRLKESERDAEIAYLKEQLLALQNKPAQTQIINNKVTTESKDVVVEIVKKWSPRVAHVECRWFNTSGDLYQKSSGSATIVNFSNLGLRAVTNKHLLVDKNKFAPKDCTIELTSGKSYSVLINKDNLSAGVEEDWTYITMPSDDVLLKLTKEDIKVCKSVEAGDRLLVLGYPKIGSKTGLTVTEGIVSAIDDSYYITSAKIDKGNSGGAAILVKDDCYLGIPSASVVGAIESLGRILKASFVIGN